MKPSFPSPTQRSPRPFLAALVGLGAASLLLAALSACSSPRLAASAPAASGDLVIENVTIVSMDGSGSLPDHGVVVRGDRIVTVEPMATLRIPEFATRVDGTGRWLMPGLADMHVHVWSEDELAMFVAAGVTTVRNMFGAELHLGWRERIACGELFGPRIVTAGPIVDGKSPMWPGSVSLSDPGEAQRIVDAQADAGYDFVKSYSGLGPAEYLALAGAAKARGFPFAGHTPWAVGLPVVMAAGQRSVEHLDGWVDALERPGHPACWQDGYFRELGRQLTRVEPAWLPGLAAEARDTETWNCPTLVVWHRVAALEDVASLRAGLRWLDLVPADRGKSWEPQNDFRFSRTDAADYATMRESNRVLGTVLGALASAGAPILAGTDQGNPFVIAGVSLLDEIELMIGAGLTRRQALEAATTNPARFLGEPGEFGVVAPGARADLILLASDPLAGPVPIPEGVVLRGRWHSGEELRAVLEGIAEKHRLPAEN